MVFLSGWGGAAQPDRGFLPPLLGECLGFLAASLQPLTRPLVVGNGNASFVTPARPGFLSGQNALLLQKVGYCGGCVFNSVGRAGS